ncbi:hypothetical protein BU16DRAFT_539845 [Lophium mytilinum]|uniref:Uncharacterized protein n=1 Tax=Lophium mytilinum TaxID=390894 RepID=A0A6A6QUH4_9PEZI|nr:hypothetical protein BU16DRAFT_539845 [Lophium mytilinum]
MPSYYFRKPFIELTDKSQREMLRNIETAAFNWRKDNLLLCIPRDMVPYKVSIPEDEFVEREHDPNEWGFSLIRSLRRFSDQTKGNLPKAQETLRAALEQQRDESLTIKTVETARIIMRRQHATVEPPRRAEPTLQADSAPLSTFTFAPLRPPQPSLQGLFHHGLPPLEPHRPTNGLPTLEPFGFARGYQQPRQGDASSGALIENVPPEPQRYPSISRHEASPAERPWGFTISNGRRTPRPMNSSSSVPSVPQSTRPASRHETYLPPTPLSRSSVSRSTASNQAFSSNQLEQPRIESGEAFGEHRPTLEPREENSPSSKPVVKLENGPEVDGNAVTRAESLKILKLREKHLEDKIEFLEDKAKLSAIKLERALAEDQRALAEKRARGATAHLAILIDDNENDDNDGPNTTQPTRRRDRESSHGVDSDGGQPTRRRDQRPSHGMLSVPGNSGSSQEPNLSFS